MYACLDGPYYSPIEPAMTHGTSNLSTNANTSTNAAADQSTGALAVTHTATIVINGTLTATDPHVMLGSTSTRADTMESLDPAAATLTGPTAGAEVTADDVTSGSPTTIRTLSQADKTLPIEPEPKPLVPSVAGEPLADDFTADDVTTGSSADVPLPVEGKALSAWDPLFMTCAWDPLFGPFAGDDVNSGSSAIASSFWPASDRLSLESQKTLAPEKNRVSTVGKSLLGPIAGGYLNTGSLEVMYMPNSNRTSTAGDSFAGPITGANGTTAGSGAIPNGTSSLIVRSMPVPRPIGTGRPVWFVVATELLIWLGKVYEAIEPMANGVAWLFYILMRTTYEVVTREGFWGEAKEILVLASKFGWYFALLVLVCFGIIVPHFLDEAYHHLAEVSTEAGALQVRHA
jgi:hypothetical protein